MMRKGQVLCVHPYQYQVGNQVESGHHLSPDIAIETLRAKLLDVNDKHKPTGQLYALGWMIAENSLANFAQATKGLFDVVNIPELGMVARRTGKEQSLQTDKFTKPNAIVQPRFKPTAQINQQPLRNALSWQGAQLAQLESLSADKNTPAQKLTALAQKRTQQLEEWTDSLNQLKQSNINVLKFEAKGTKQQRGGDSITLAVIPSVRPGAIINQKRITQVHFEKDEMTLYWKTESSEKRKMNYLFPELAAGHHLPRFARVEAVTDQSTAGHENNPYRPRYAVDVQLLTEHGEVDSLVPIYKAVPLPTVIGGAEQEQFATPSEGTIVEIAFAYGRCDKPFIRTILDDGWSLPELEPDEQLQQQRHEVFNKTDAAGNTTNSTDQIKHTQAFEHLHEVDKYLGDFGVHELNVKQYSKEIIAGQKLIETLGAFEVMAGDDVTLGSLSNLHLVNGGNQTQIIGQLRDIVIGLNDKLSVLGERVHIIEKGDTLIVNDKQTITISKDQIIQAMNITQDAQTIKLNGGAGVITCESICPYTGKPHVDGSTTVFAGK